MLYRGQYAGDEDTRLRILREAFTLDTFVDVELEAMRGFGDGMLHRNHAS